MPTTGLRRCPVALMVGLAFWKAIEYAVETIEFKTYTLDIIDRSHIDLSRFLRLGISCRVSIKWIW